MVDPDHRPSTKHHYPSFYERAIPIALGIIVVALVLLLLIVFGVALGVW
jgi:hypothetical protein